MPSIYRSQQGISVTSSSSDEQRKRKHDKLSRRDSSSDTDSSVNDVDDPKTRQVKKRGWKPNLGRSSSSSSTSSEDEDETDRPAEVPVQG